MFYKNLLFSAIVVSLFFAGCEAILAVAGVQPVLSTEDPFVGFAENIPLFTRETRPDGATVVRTADNKLLLFNYQAFPARKGDGVYRVFCVGGSTTFGRPYDDPVSFCGWLRAYLKAADPARNWEIINAGGVSYASYRVTRLMQELAQYEPDLFIVYTGQNEFLEQRSYGRLADLPVWLVNLNAALSGTRVYTAMSRAIGLVKPDALEQARKQYRLSGEVDTVLDHTVGPQSYRRDDELKQHITLHFRLNLERMIGIARAAGAGIVLVNPAINLKDISPFKSEHSLDLAAAALADWQELYERGQALAGAGDYRQALVAYRAALALDDRHAELHYRIGKALFSLGDYGEAEISFRRAVEEDVAPLRMLEQMQHDLVDVAATAQVPLVDFAAILRDASLERYGHGVFGREYFVDHVHTSVEGYRMLGQALFDELVRLDIARPAVAMNEALREAVRQQVLGQLNAADEGHALAKLARVFAWAGKFIEAYDLFRRALDILGPRPELYDQLARSAYASGDYAASIRHLQELLEAFPASAGAHAKLAAIHANLGETGVAIDYCREELALSPDDYRTIAMLAELLERQGQDDVARQQYELALQLEPGHERALLGLAFLLIRQERYEEALPHAREIVQRHPEQFLGHNALGLIFMHLGDLELAVHHFREALRLQPGDVETTNNLQQLQAEQRGGDMTVYIPREICTRLPDYADRCLEENL